VAHAHAANELAERLWVKQVTDHAVALALVEAALWPTGHDTACILPAEGEGEEGTACQLSLSPARGRGTPRVCPLSLMGGLRERTGTYPRCWRSWRPSASSGATLFCDARRTARMPPARVGVWVRGQL